jgi:hypothetical protein
MNPMARPLRLQWKVRTLVRRRHRTWVHSMTLATLGWGVWWFAILLHKFVPGLSPGLGATYVVTCALAGVGFVLAQSVRAGLDEDGPPAWLVGSERDLIPEIERRHGIGFEHCGHPLGGGLGKCVVLV